MKEWLDEAVVLRMGHFREADLWLRLLCRGRGALTLFAFGASRSRRRFCGCLDVFNTLQCRVRVSARGDFLNLEEAALLRGPRDLRADWRRMGVATNCLRFLEALGVDGEGAAESFALLEDLREALERGSPVPQLLALFFRLRLAGALGFAPNLGQCGVCGADVGERASFVVDDGLLLCPACRAARPLAETRYCVEVSRRGLDLLRAVQQTFPSAWPAEELPAPERRACARLIDGFVQYHLGLAWENGRFRHV
ncbi:MAG: DNA repair protein RecO [Desulfovibrio sp.]|nr:DNA repair protein RecO [Desulfovibrio sp.]